MSKKGVLQLNIAIYIYIYTDILWTQYFIPNINGVLNKTIFYLRKIRITTLYGHHNYLNYYCGLGARYVSVKYSHVYRLSRGPWHHNELRDSLSMSF